MSSWLSKFNAISNVSSNYITNIPGRSSNDLFPFKLFNVLKSTKKVSLRFCSLRCPWAHQIFFLRDFKMKNIFFGTFWGPEMLSQKFSHRDKWWEILQLYSIQKSLYSWNLLPKLFWLRVSCKLSSTFAFFLSFYDFCKAIFKGDSWRHNAKPTYNLENNLTPF